MIENKWVNGGIAIAIAGALAGVAVWMSSGPSPEQAPKGDQTDLVDDNDPAAPPDRLGRPPSDDQVENETEAAPPDMGGLKPPTKG